jgi:phage-related protein
MMPWFIWKGKNSLADFGLWINKLPMRIRPEERHDEIEIPGRAGSLLILEGDDVYNSYVTEMFVLARNTLQIDRIMEWLRGSGDLIVSTDISKARQVRIVGEVAFDRVSNDLMQATIPFLCQPFRKSVHPTSDRFSISASNGTVFNPGDVASKPIISITGTGNNTITIAGNAMTFTDLSGTVVVDCGAQIITKNGEIWTGSVIGKPWSIPVGESTLVQTGSMTITIDPEWRWH